MNGYGFPCQNYISEIVLVNFVKERQVYIIECMLSGTEETRAMVPR